MNLKYVINNSKQDNYIIKKRLRFHNFLCTIIIKQIKVIYITKPYNKTKFCYLKFLIK